MTPYELVAAQDLYNVRNLLHVRVSKKVGCLKIGLISGVLSTDLGNTIQNNDLRFDYSVTSNVSYVSWFVLQIQGD